MTGALIIILCMYIIMLVLFLSAWLSIRDLSPSQTTYHYTIIVPFRNEAPNLPSLITSLRGLAFPQSRYKVILVNDHSEDDYMPLITELPTNFEVLHLPEVLAGKKAAIAHGVTHSETDIIITTDADCQHHADWLNAFDAVFAQPGIQLVFGGVLFRTGGGLFAAMQRHEFASLIGVGAACWRLSKPVMCNGANLAFRKSVFHEVGGYGGNEQVASGDDEFLLEKIVHRYPDGIRYVSSADAVVQTRAVESLGDFVAQRKRWAGKWRAGGWFKSVLAVFVAAVAVSTLIAGVHLIVTPDKWLASPLIVKIIMEAVFIAVVMAKLGGRFSFFTFLLLQLIYPVYAMLFAIMANMGGVRWKGREIVHK